MPPRFTRKHCGKPKRRQVLPGRHSEISKWLRVLRGRIRGNPNAPVLHAEALRKTRMQASVTWQAFGKTRMVASPCLWLVFSPTSDFLLTIFASCLILPLVGIFTNQRSIVTESFKFLVEKKRIRLFAFVVAVVVGENTNHRQSESGYSGL